MLPWDCEEPRKVSFLCVSVRARLIPSACAVPSGAGAVGPQELLCLPVGPVADAVCVLLIRLPPGWGCEEPGSDAAAVGQGY